MNSRCFEVSHTEEVSLPNNKNTAAMTAASLVATASRQGLALQMTEEPRLRINMADVKHQKVS